MSAESSSPAHEGGAPRDADAVLEAALARLRSLGGDGFVVEMIDLFADQVAASLAEVDRAVRSRFPIRFHPEASSA